MQEVTRGAYEYIQLNTPPTTAEDAYETRENTPLTVPSPGVVANDSDADGDSLSAVLGAGPAHGSLILNDDAAGGFTYIPNDGYSGQDSFTYRAYDGVDYSGESAVVITVKQYYA